MSYLPYYTDTDIGTAAMEQVGRGAGVWDSHSRSGQSARLMPNGADGVGSDTDEIALQQVLARLQAGADVRGFQEGIEAGHRVLGNRAFMHWMGELQSGGREAVAPLQLMGKKKKKPEAVEVEAGSGEQAAGAEGEAGVVAEGTALPGREAARPQASGTLPGVEPETVEGAAGAAKKKKKKSRVQVALNTLRGEGVAAFEAYIEAEIGEPELLRTLVERITRAEDLGGVRKAALGVVEGRLCLLPRKPGAGRREPEMAVIAPINSEFNMREMELFDACIKGDSIRFRRYFRPELIGINKCSENGTLLYGAACLGRTKILETLLTAPGIDVNLAQHQGATPLFMAAQEGHVKIVELLLGKVGINVNLATSRGVTPLYIAASHGRVDVVKLLLGMPEINVNLETLTDRTTALSIAAQNGQEEVVKLLLAAPGIGIDMQKEDGATALFMAVQLGFTGIVKQLVRRGADVSLAKDEGVTPLYVAAFVGNIEILKILLQVPGIQVDLATDDGGTPLGIAAQLGHKEIVRLLLRKGADPNRVNQSGATSLYVACLHGHTAIVQILLHAGADMDAGVTNLHGMNYTPCSLAELGGHREVMSALAAHRRHRASAPPLLGQLSITETTAEDTGTSSLVSGTEVETDAVAARASPVPRTPSPPGEAAPETQAEAITPLEQAKDALRQEVLGKLRADNFNTQDRIHLLQDINATHNMDALCVLYNRLAHIERQKERVRRRKRVRVTQHMALGPGPAAAAPAAVPVFALGRKTGLDADRVEIEIKKHLGQEYHRFVSQAVNNMEFGRGKGTAGYPGLLHASAGVAGVGSCSVFYYLDGERNRIRVVGIGHHAGRASYRLDYAAAELGEVGRILRIA